MTDAPRQRSWPLFLVAGSALLPGVGFLFGVAAVIWGLLSSRPRALSAAVIGGAGALLNVVGGVLLLWRFQRNPAYTNALAVGTQADLVKLVGALEDYRSSAGRYPTDLVVFTQLPLALKFINVQDHSAGLIAKPRWYRYELSSNGRTYDLFAVGADGKAGTDDDIRPVLPDSLARRSGYRSGGAGARRHKEPMAVTS